MIKSQLLGGRGWVERRPLLFRYTDLRVKISPLCLSAYSNSRTAELSFYYFNIVECSAVAVYDAGIY